MCDEDCEDGAVLLFSDADARFDCRFGDSKQVLRGVFTADFLVKPKGLVISGELSLITLLSDKHGPTEELDPPFFANFLLPILFCGKFHLLGPSTSEDGDKS